VTLIAGKRRRLLFAGDDDKRGIYVTSPGVYIEPPGLLQRNIARGLRNRLMRRLQSVQNAAARRDHITPILRRLHWLPVRRRVDFKIAVLVYQCLTVMTGQAPCYLAEDCQLVADVSARRLRSADTATSVTRRTSNIFGDRCFAAAGPRLRNSLPINLRQCYSLEQFKRLLKTFLFSV